MVAGSHNGGLSQLGVNSLQGSGEFAFINAVKGAQAWAWVDGNSTTPLTPDLFDNNGYPIPSSLFTTHGGVQTQNMFIPSQAEYAGNYVITWTGTGTVDISRDSIVSGSLSGTNGRCVFAVSATALTLKITATSAAPNNVQNIKVYNINDETALNSGQIFGTTFLQKINTAKFGVIRFLGWQSGNVCNASNWDTGNRSTDYFSYHTDQFRPDILCNAAGSGVTTSSGADYAVSAPANWATSGGLPADKSTIHLVWNASSPTAALVSATGGGSPNITWTGHGLATGNQVYPTADAGALPAELTASALGTFPQTYYFVTVIDANTITLSATSGGAAINYASSASFELRTNVTLNVAGTGAIQVRSETADSLTSSGNSFPVGGSKSSLSTLTYDATLNCWIKFGGTIGPAGIANGIPLSICLSLCAQVGAHPWLVSPPFACTPMTDWHTQLATLAKTTMPSWMIPRFEGANETWNTAGGFTQTGYANQVSSAYGWGKDFNNWYGRIMSTIGQAVAAVYGVAQANVKTQNLYQVMGGVQTSLANSPAVTSTYNTRLQSTKYLLQTPQSGYIASAASNWVTHVVCSNYITPSMYGRNEEVQTAFDYYVTNSGNPTAQAADAVAFEATIMDGFACTVTTGSPGQINGTNSLLAGEIITFFTDGAFPGGLSTSNLWVASAGNPFTISSTDPNNGGTTLVNITSTGSGNLICTPNAAVSSVPVVNIFAKNIAAWAAGLGVTNLAYYEGAYSPPVSGTAVTSSITAATNASQCVLTTPTTSVQSIRFPNNANGYTPAAVAGMYLKLSGFAGNFATYNNQVVQVVSVSGQSITVNLDTTLAGAFSGSGTATYYLDSGATQPMYLALNALRQAGKSAPNLVSHTLSSYAGLTAISGAGFPSAFLLSASNVGLTGGVWQLFSPDVFQSALPQWTAVVLFNARKRRMVW